MNKQAGCGERLILMPVQRVAADSDTTWGCAETGPMTAELSRRLTQESPCQRPRRPWRLPSRPRNPPQSVCQLLLSESGEVQSNPFSFVFALLLCFLLLLHVTALIPFTPTSNLRLLVVGQYLFYLKDCKVMNLGCGWVQGGCNEHHCSRSSETSKIAGGKENDGMDFPVLVCECVCVCLFACLDA